MCELSTLQLHPYLLPIEMKTMTLAEIKSEARDLFSYILIGCPDFPLGTGSTTKKEFEKLIDLIDVILGRTKSDEAKQWLAICVQETRKSWKYYNEGKLERGREMIQQAEEHFNNALSNKSIEPRFLAGESGAALDNEKGFTS